MEKYIDYFGEINFTGILPGSFLCCLVPMIKYMKKKDFRLSLFSWTLAACLLAGVQPSACGEEGQAMVEIESEPIEFAAHLWIALDEGKMPSDEERKQERKRTRLGAGEIVKLNLSGKKALIGNPETLKWIIEKGKGNQWATIETKPMSLPCFQTRS